MVANNIIDRFQELYDDRDYQMVMELYDEYENGQYVGDIDTDLKIKALSYASRDYSMFGLPTSLDNSLHRKQVIHKFMMYFPREENIIRHIMEFDEDVSENSDIVSFYSMFSIAHFFVIGY